MRLCFNTIGDPLSYRINFELVLTEPVLVAVKTYDLNLPEICINAILAEIERLNSTNSAVIQTTSSRETEIRELKEELQMMREKLKEAEENLAKQKPRLWHR
jgi:selenocysteine-specific translation elongation factor